MLHMPSDPQANAYTGVDEPILSLVFSPDDEKLAGVSADGKLLIYAVNATSGCMHAHAAWPQAFQLVVIPCHAFSLCFEIRTVW